MDSEAKEDMAQSCEGESLLSELEAIIDMSAGDGEDLRSVMSPDALLLAVAEASVPPPPPPPGYDAEDDEESQTAVMMEPSSITSDGTAHWVPGHGIHPFAFLLRHPILFFIPLSSSPPFPNLY